MNEEQAPRKARLIPAEEVFAELRERPGYTAAYDALEDEFSIMSELIRARTRSARSRRRPAASANSASSAAAT